MKSIFLRIFKTYLFFREINITNVCLNLFLWNQCNVVLFLVPRAVKQLFSGITKRQDDAREAGLPPPEFKVSAQFMELYNEEILDLFDNASCSVSKSSNGPVGGLGKRSTSAGGSTGIRIHEDANGNIYTVRKMKLWHL